MVEWECCLKHPEDGAREGADFVDAHIIRVTEKAFDDFAGAGTDRAANRRMLGWSEAIGGQLPTPGIFPRRRGQIMAIDAAHAARAPRIRLGMVGGGRDAFIGAVHRIAARIDDQYELVAGCFLLQPREVAGLGRRPRRRRARYGSFAEMAVARGPPQGRHRRRRHRHPEPHARARWRCSSCKRGIHVICDKPLTATLPEAKKLAKAAEASGVVFALTHNYTGYPMIRQAKAMVAAGDLGEIRLVQVEYVQDWLTEPVEAPGQKQADWRTDPARSGAGGSTGDIGTHAFNLANFVTGPDAGHACRRPAPPSSPAAGSMTTAMC